MASFTSTKAQAWSMDFIVGILMFVVALTIYFVYTNNASEIDQNILSNLISDSKQVSSSLVSEGYPKDWDNSSVIRIGLTNNNQRLQLDKLSNFSSINYNKSKSMLGTYYNYFVFFEYENGSVIKIKDLCGTGSPDVKIDYLNQNCIINITNINPDYLIKTDRYLIYNNYNKSRLIKMVLYLWQ